MNRIVVVVPLRPGAHATARVLVADGAPLPLESTGIDRHEVFLTDREAVFVFEGRAPTAALEHLLAEPAVWRAATAWRDCVDGEPRIADAAFSWERKERPLHVPGF